MKHGLSRTRVYNIWKKMIYRCYKRNNNRYYCYGGKGIKVCSDWKEDFLNFYNWALSNGYADNLTIERKDIKKGYSPENCTWVDYTRQANNKSNNHFITYNGEKHTIADWARILKKNYNSLKSSIRNGASLKEVIEA